MLRGGLSALLYARIYAIIIRSVVIRHEILVKNKSTYKKGTPNHEQ